MPALLDNFGLMAWEQGRKKGKKGEKPGRGKRVRRK